MKVKVNTIIVPEDRFRKEIGDLTELIGSIKELGLIQPIIIDSNNYLIVGERRLEAYKKLDIDLIEAVVIDFDNPIQAQIDENTIRKELLPPEIRAIYQYIHSAERKKPGPKPDNYDTTGAAIKPIEKAAKLTGVSKNTISKINKIYQSSHEDLKKEVEEGKKSIDLAYNIIKKCEKDEKSLLKPVKDSERLELEALPYGSNIVYLPRTERGHWSSDTINEDDPFPTMTTQSAFFHPAEPGSQKKEFTIMEYASVQDFPGDFKFVSNTTIIRRQIGNAVSPKMGAHITKDLKGKTCGDLFAECGGFSLGAHKNGIRSVWAVEWDPCAAKSYQLNFPGTKVYNENIKLMNPNVLEKVDIIIGGPPCQGFSRAGYQYKDDPKNVLYKEFLRFVEALKPGELIMENVPEIAKIKDEIIKDFEEIGYEVRTELVKGEEIGMRQKRQRFFFIGTKRQKLLSQFATKTD
jgi:ParB/RepB/Spo0J family partition protein